MTLLFLKNNYTDTKDICNENPNEFNWIQILKINPRMHNVLKWSDTLLKNFKQMLKDF